MCTLKKKKGEHIVLESWHKVSRSNPQPLLEGGKDSGLVEAFLNDYDLWQPMRLKPLV